MNKNQVEQETALLFFSQQQIFKVKSKEFMASNRNVFDTADDIYSEEDRLVTSDDSQQSSRRNFIKKYGALAAAGVIVGWTPVQKIHATVSDTTKPVNFPSDINLYKQSFENWSGEIKVDDLWTCAPKTQSDVLRIVNWAAANDYRVRARGMGHNWSPLMLQPKQAAPRVIFVDTTSYLNNVSIDPAGIVTAETGVTMETLLSRMQDMGMGFTATPAPGDLTLGGVLAIDGHGTAVPALGEQRQVGHSYGSMSNLVTSLTAVVYDSVSRKYVAKVFRRRDADISALLTSLGRAFILSVQLQAGKNQRLRCQSFTDIDISELFAADPKAGRTFSHFLDTAGRVEAIWFPFTTKPWLKVWTVCPTKPATAKTVTAPFNYLFSDNVPKVITDLVGKIVVNQNVGLTPLFGQTQLQLCVAGLNGTPLSGLSTALTGGAFSTQSKDLWGWSKDLLLYVKPTTLRVTANGYAVITRRDNVQRVISDFINNYKTRVAQYQKLNRYPMNGPIEIRVTGLDKPSDVVVSGAQTPALSAVKPCPDHPDWDCAVWFDILTLPGTPFAEQFYHETEQWMINRYQDDSLIRPEWSKGWGYTTTGTWNNDSYLLQEIPKVHRQGQPALLTIETAKATLNRLDPKRIFSSPLLDKFL